jgi:cytochrome c oxidase subunit 1
VPEVEARDDWWHRKYTEDDRGLLVRLPSGGADEHEQEHAPSEGHKIHLPSPSFFPLVLCIGLPMLGYAAVYHLLWAGIIGAIVLAFGAYAWAIEPPTAESE